ncbi:hypothetical protein M434DRAFT_395188 [Hypoxylon sp. CO27-5]|nr:hypothetical protein M434DRAFT_395188 [Hypoxylon sp. CO27-5]
MDHMVFRLRQLPPDINTISTTTLLSKALDIDPSAIRIFSLARSLDLWIPWKVATLMFNDDIKIENVLEGSKLPNITKQGDEWRIRVENMHDNSLILDVHFRGLTPLYDPPPALYAADCIAISGLASHPFGSWQPKDRSKSFMWIRDTLPKSLPHIRPILYGYDTTLVKSQSFQSIFDIALGLISHLKANGWASPTCKPLAFLAHSLGGIVLKQAFVSLAHRIKHDDPILHAIKGAVLFGVPNLGMEQSHLEAVVDGQPNKQLISDLSVNSEYLQQLDEQFGGISYLQNAILYWCYETRKSPTVIRDLDGRWSRTGPEEILVTPHSATRGLYRETMKSDSIFPINEDHSNIVKFSENDPNYAIVAQKLEYILPRREADPKTNNEQETPESNVTLGQEHDSESIIDSLYVPESDRRIREVEEKFGHTFDWIYDRPEPGFDRWLRSPNPLFWINGKPGSGKSTLMKFIFKDRRTSDLLSDWKGQNTYIRAGFFFHYRGSPIQKSFEGLLRSVLSQVVSENRRLSKFLSSLLDKKSLTSEDWSLEILKKGLHDILVQEEVPLNLCLFLDALDEYDGRLELICQFLTDLAKIPQTPYKRIKICFSSRPWEIFTHAFRRCYGFRIQDFTQADIRDYCLGSIKNERLPSVALENLIPDIVTRSRGVFLWVKLVVKDLAQAMRTTTLSKVELKKQLESLPIELDSYYSEIINRIPYAHRWKTYAMLETTVRFQGSLNPKDLICIVRCSEPKVYQEALDALQNLYDQGVSDFADLVRRESRMYCGGLIEVVTEQDRAYIQVLHQTVEDFVTNPKFKHIVLEDRARITVENGNTFLAKYAMMPNQSNFWYGTYYAYLAEQTSGRSMKAFLDSIPDTVLQEKVSLRTPLAYAAFAGLRLYIIESVDESPNILRDCQEPLLTHTTNPDRFLTDDKFLKTVKVLLDGGFQPKHDPGLFTLYVGIAREQRVSDPLDMGSSNETIGDLVIDLLQLLLDYGQNPNLDIEIKKNSHRSRPSLLERVLKRSPSRENGRDVEAITPLDYLLLVKTEWGAKSIDEVRVMYRVISLISDRGGIIKATQQECLMEALNEFSKRGLSIEDLESRLLPLSLSPPEPEPSRQSLRSKLRKTTSRLLIR